MAVTTGTRSSRRNRLITDINITPLVDVVLVLLVVLMVVSTYIVTQAMKVELPKAATQDEVNQEPLTIVILRDGSLRLNDQPIDESDLIDELNFVARSRPGAPVVISADRAAPYGRAVQFVDYARQAGFTQFAIKVEEER
jgi:biopolymer transport protein ExbD